MSTANAHASSSKPTGKRQENGKGKARGKGQIAQPRLKSNQAKRQQADEELKDLQARIDAFVSPLLAV
jgi:ATP-dependent RNA helicase DDX10/DBP4